MHAGASNQVVSFVGTLAARTNQSLPRYSAELLAIAHAHVHPEPVMTAGSASRNVAHHTELAWTGQDTAAGMLDSNMFSASPKLSPPCCAWSDQTSMYTAYF
jgi:hypothetical protein